jgi:hypothetical protein
MLEGNQTDDISLNDHSKHNASQGYRKSSPRMNCRAKDHINIQNMYKMSSPSPDRGPDCEEEMKVDQHNTVLAMSSDEGFYSNDEDHKQRGQNRHH